jgi:hypothetical protein
VDENKVSAGHPNGAKGKEIVQSPSDETPPPALTGDITFEDRPGGFEVWYSDRIVNLRDLVEESADWLEGQPSVKNLGLIDYKILIADGLLTENLRNGLVAWWQVRIEDLDLG